MVKEDPSPNNNDTITTLIFDVDDTLYDVGTGFTALRNGPCVHQFMVEQLDFPDHASAQAVRDSYFERYHATAKALQVAEAEGAFPPSTKLSPRFDPQDLAEYWAEHLDYSLLGGEKSMQFQNDLMELRNNNLFLVAFSNGPRKYVKQVLKTLGLWGNIFDEDTLFAVDDVLPYCKPEPKAFEVIFERIFGTSTSLFEPSQCVMVEDSMKNVRVAKRLGLRTVLITGARNNKTDALASLLTKPGDAPDCSDPSVDVSMEIIEDLRSKLPALWATPARFDPK